MSVALPVNEIFETIQGEGVFTGFAAVFIRLQGCQVGCPWCDTRHTWSRAAGDKIASGEMLTKDQSPDGRWAAMSADAIVKLLAGYRAQHVVITGGEPAEHDLGALTEGIIEAGRSVQIETSGTYPLACHAASWVTVSPKVGMPGGRTVLDAALARADEIKMPVGRMEDIEALHRLIDRGQIREGVPISVQPLSLSKKATELCRANAIANGWRVSLQLHALAGWR